MILRGKAVVAAFRVVLIQLIGRRGQELQCYRNLTFVPVSPILKIFLFSDGPSQPPSIPKYVSATNVLKDGYRGHIVVHLHSILITVSPILVCVFVDRPLWSPVDPDIARLLVLPVTVSVLRIGDAYSGTQQRRSGS